MAIDDINDDTRAIGNRLGLDPPRKQSGDSFVMADFNSPNRQMPFRSPAGATQYPLSLSNSIYPPPQVQPSVAPAPFSTSTTKGKIFPTSQSPDMPHDSRYSTFRSHLVRQAWKEFKLWNAKGSQMHVADNDNDARGETLKKYWKDVFKIYPTEPENEYKYFESLINHGPYKNWGAVFIAFLVYESLKSATNVSKMEIQDFTYRNSFNIYLAARNTNFYIKKKELQNYLVMLQNNTGYNPPLSTNARAQNLTYIQYNRIVNIDKRPLFFDKYSMVDGTVLCEPGDILCLKDSAAEKDVLKQVFRTAKLPNVVPPMKELKVHYDCELIVYSVFNSKTNKIIIRTIGGNINNSVKSRLYYFDIKSDPSTGENYYDLRSNLILGIMKFPSTMASFTYPVM
ncbi:MAG: hypothetical protein JNL49_07745 [Bacteroidia bacterium]|nr:hypothetical protein [Bacteroidia bacterium]